MKGYWHIVALGIIMIQFYDHFDNIWFIGIFLCWLMLLFSLKRLPFKPFMVTLCCMGAIYAYDVEEITVSKEVKTDKQVTLEGVVKSTVSKNEKKLRFVFALTNSKQKVSVIYFPTSKKPQYPKTIRHGATCNITGKWDKPQMATNPGQFDFQKYLEKQQITEQFIISSLEDVQCEGSSYLQSLYDIRNHLFEKTARQLSDTTTSWLHALLIGSTDLLDEDLVELFREWGLSHILAISGLHVGLITSIMYMVLVKTNILTRESATWLLIVFLPMYAVIAGGAPSVWRSSLMVVMALLCQKYTQRLHTVDIISIVCILLLLIFPQNIFHVGFQFSFLVTIALLLSRQWILNTRSRWMQAFRISFISQMAILPIQLMYFYQFQPLSIVLNIVVIPYFSVFVIPLLCIILVCMLIGFPFVMALDSLFVSVHELFLHILQLTTSHISTLLLPGKIPLLFILIYYVLLFVMMYFIHHIRLKRAFITGVCIILLLLYIPIRPYLSAEGSVTMLDIGQGDAIVIELPYRKGVMFIDAGATFSFEDHKPTEKVFENVIKPYLYERGIQHIDAVFLSHEDLDHDGSVPFMLQKFSIDEIIVSPYYQPSDMMLDAWKLYGAKVNIVEAGKDYTIKGQRFKVLTPLIETDSANENSLVLHAKFAGKDFIFTGDIGVATEKQIMQSYPNLPIDVLKVGHHGSKTSTGEEFVKFYQPAFGMISVGRHNRYGHPAKQVIDVLEQENVHVLRTDKMGAIQFRFKEDEGYFYHFLIK
ncbi:MAG TPA: DNA internalization-related competence protein ComEC/Rec2 [Candidatus Avamphibacillus intestinigallinarum]|nr:DNA internalization-related competence protein ComEC/Rec2 [Candidatus Avamphibacillus intestinigallinarum]